MAEPPIPPALARQLAEQTAMLNDAVLELIDVTREARRRMIRRHQLEEQATSVTPATDDRRSLVRGRVLAFGRAADRASRR